MEISLEFSTTTITCTFAFILFLYLIFLKSRNTPQQPPQAAGSWPLLGHLLLLGGPQPPHITLGKLADKYGPIFTIKFGVHRTVIVSNWEIAKECFTTNDLALANRPKTLVMDLMGYNYSMIGLSQYGHYWRQVRKMATIELLCSRRLEILKPVRESEVKMFVKELYRHGSDEMDMKQWLGDLTRNILFRMIVGQRFSGYRASSSSSDNEEIGRWRETVSEYIELLGKFTVSDAMPYLGWLDLGGWKKIMKKNMKEIDRVAEAWLAEHKQRRKETGGKEEDFMDAMLTFLDGTDEMTNNTPDSDTIIKATSLALVVAGSDSTYVTLVWALSLLLNNKQALKKIQDELDVHVGKQRQVRESDITNLVYLEAVIKETLRLYPAAPLSLPHESITDCNINGFHVPAGTRLFANLSKIHRDPSVWSNPDEFNPERFVTTHKHIDVRGQNFQLIPFGAGRRMCPGVLLAMQALQLTLASLLHGFDIQTTLNQPIGMLETSGLINDNAAPLNLVLVPRLPGYLY